MPANYGRRPFQTTGYAVRASADGNPNFKIGGITLSGTKLPVNGTGSPLTLTLDQTIVATGAAYLLLGTVMCRIGAAADTLTITGAPTGGTFTASVNTSAGVQTTAGIAYNATAATLQTALVGLSNVGAGNATVTGSAGGPYSVSFPAALGTVVLTASGALLTGGTTPAATVTTLETGTDTGMFAQYDASATDGRQTLNYGDCFVLDETWLDTPVPAFPQQGSAHPAVFDGGRVDVRKLVLSTGQGVNALPAGYPAGPTLSAFTAAFPRISLVND